MSTKGIRDDVGAELRAFLGYVENTTDEFARQSGSPLVRQIQERVNEIKRSKEMEVEYMTLLMRDRENLRLGREEGREEGTALAAKVIRLYTRGMSPEEIGSSLRLPPEYVRDVIEMFENG